MDNSNMNNENGQIVSNHEEDKKKPMPKVPQDDGGAQGGNVGDTDKQKDFERISFSVQTVPNQQGRSRSVTFRPSTKPTSGIPASGTDAKSAELNSSQLNKPISHNGVKANILYMTPVTVTVVEKYKRLGAIGAKTGEKKTDKISQPNLRLTLVKKVVVVGKHDGKTFVAAGQRKTKLNKKTAKINRPNLKAILAPVKKVAVVSQPIVVKAADGLSSAGKAKHKKSNHHKKMRRACSKKGHSMRAKGLQLHAARKGARFSKKRVHSKKGHSKRAKHATRKAARLSKKRSLSRGSRSHHAKKVSDPKLKEKAIPVAANFLAMPKGSTLKKVSPVSKKSGMKRHKRRGRGMKSHQKKSHPNPKSLSVSVTHKRKAKKRPHSEIGAISTKKRHMMTRSQTLKLNNRKDFDIKGPQTKSQTLKQTHLSLMVKTKEDGIASVADINSGNFATIKGLICPTCGRKF